MGGRSYDLENEEGFSAKSPEVLGDSSLLSGDEEAFIPSPRKRRRCAQKKVVTVPAGGGEGCRSKGDAHPPPDSWAWRKYGQKPIKGSPFPRGYYRCSSSKGCPARKQVERSRHDPTTILITYSSEHNHPLPVAAAAKTHVDNPPVKPDPELELEPEPEPEPEPASPSIAPDEEHAALATQPDIELAAGGGYSELAGELGWLCEVGSTMMEGTTFVGPVAGGRGEMEVAMPIGEEDELLFGDLGDLPGCSFVSRRADLTIET